MNYFLYRNDKNWYTKYDLFSQAGNRKGLHKINYIHAFDNHKSAKVDRKLVNMSELHTRIAAEGDAELKVTMTEQK